MALTKRTYVDGETIITAQNLNDIQDEIISNTNNKANKSATVSNVSYNSSSKYLQKTINGTTSNVMLINNVVSLGITEVTS